MNVKVKVTLRDIQKGTKSWLWNPVSFAVCRAFGVSEGRNAPGGATVCDDYILVDRTGDGECASWATPKEVKLFLDNFWKGKRYAHPFEFQLRNKKFGTLHLVGRG